MRRTKIFIGMTALALTMVMGLASCSSSNVEEEFNSNLVKDENGTVGVKPEFVISIPRTVVNTSTTRMGSDVTQSKGTVEQFRGMDNIRLISFASQPNRSTSKLSNILNLGAIQSLASAGKLNYKVYADQFVPVGTRNFLFYAKAIDGYAGNSITTQGEKFHYGYLKYTGLNDTEFQTPSDINFSLEQINTLSTAQLGNPAGMALVDLLNSLALATVSASPAPHDKWSTCTSPLMRALYRNFIGITTCSSQGVAHLLSTLYFSLADVDQTDPAYPLATSLRTAIANACTTALVSGEPAPLNSEYLGYPNSLGLPTGAARIRWNAGSSSFIDVPGNYGADLKPAITQYTYPAALWYYVNTPLKASSNIESPSYEEEDSWDNVISKVYEGAADEVEDNTQSVALKAPAQYGVGRLEANITMGSGTFYDGNGEPVKLGSGFTLTGLLIGGQNSVGFDFISKGNENLTIYDRDVADGINVNAGSSSSTNQTLALETKANQVVNMALELRNGGADFMGADGIIPAGGTFYLAARLDPLKATNYASGTLDKIFIQDHVTRLTITIENGSTVPDRNGDGIPDVYIKDPDGNPTGVDDDGDGDPDPYDIDGDGDPDDFITDPDHGGPGWDTDGDGEVDRPVTPDPATGEYPDNPNVPEGLGNATNGVPDLTSPLIELGTSVNLQWQQGLILTPSI